MILTSNNKILVHDGFVLKPMTLPPLEFEIGGTGSTVLNQGNGDYFPPYYSASTKFLIFRSKIANTIYIDFGDGSPIYEANMTANVNWTLNGNSKLHEYKDNLGNPDFSRKKVKIRFKYAGSVDVFQTQFMKFVGEFPKMLGLYNLDTLSIIRTMFDTFPTDFKGGNFKNLTLNNLSSVMLTYLPDWVTQSRVQTLVIGGFNLSNPATNNLDKLVNIVGLTTLHFRDNMMINNTSLPTNLKDIATLKIIYFGNNPLENISKKINDIKQLEDYRIGTGSATTGVTNSSFTHWGEGVANMPNLKALYVISQVDDGVLEATAPTGLATAPLLKTIRLDSIYNTQARIDAFINDLYDKVVANASMTVGNTLLRQVALNIAQSTNTLYPRPPRPTGVYEAPPGFELGVSNGTPATPFEKLWVLGKQYNWVITVTATGSTGNVVLVP